MGCSLFPGFTPTETELLEAQTLTGQRLRGKIRFEMYRHGNITTPEDVRKRWVEIRERVTLFVDGLRVLMKRDSGVWESKNVRG